MSQEVYYSEYLQLDKILDAQAPKSFEAGKTQAHDEMLFIIIHQAYELWFKQILFEVGSVIQVMEKGKIADSSPDLYLVHHRLNRCVKIMEVLVHQIDILDTLTPLDFLDFRNLLRPASGFQSVQFKVLEALLGLKMEERHGKQYYTSQLKEADRQKIKNIEQKSSLILLINKWLERMPFFDEAESWVKNENETPKVWFWEAYAQIYQNSLKPEESYNFDDFKNSILADKLTEGAALSPKAKRAALFIMLYRDYPLLQLPFQILDILLEIDNALSAWRYKHVNMVHRMIGTRAGTGGSSGKDYLRAAADKHYIFKEVASLTSFLIERRFLPELPTLIKEKLMFRQE